MLKIKVSGMRTVSKNLNGLAKDLSDIGLHNFFKETKNVIRPVEESSKRVIKTSGTNIKRKYIGLKKATIREKKRLGYSLKPLIRTRKLMNTFDKNFGRGFVEIGKPVEYAHYHHFGLGHNKKRLTMGVDDKANKIIMKNLFKYVDRKISKNNLK